MFGYGNTEVLKKKFTTIKILVGLWLTRKLRRALARHINLCVLLADETLASHPLLLFTTQFISKLDVIIL